MKTHVLLFALAAAAAEIIGGTLITIRRSWPKRAQETLLSFGAGFLLALVFVELIPTSFKLVGGTAPLYILGGFATLHFFEHAIVGHLHFGEEIHSEMMVTKVAGLSAFVGLFVHAVFDGLTISVGMQYDLFLGLLVFFAVLLHKFPEGLTLGSIMLKAGYRRRAVLYSVGGLASATILGASSVFLLASVDTRLVGMVFAFSAGTVVYVGASDLIPEINKTESRIPPLLVFAGMLLFYLTEKLLSAAMG